MASIVPHSPPEELAEANKKIQWHDYTKLFKMKDINGKQPAYYIAMSNRGGGKTFKFSSELIEYCAEHGGSFGLLCVHKNELGSVAAGMLNEVIAQKIPGAFVKEVKESDETFSTVNLYRPNKTDEKGKPVGEPIGFVFPLAAHEQLKRKSSLFANVNIMFMDEIQSKSVTEQVVEEWFPSLMMTIARGGGKAARYVPVLMACNSLDVFSPFLRAFGLSTRILDNTRYLRGDGVVLERFRNKTVADAQEASPLMRPFKNTAIYDSNVNNAWLNSDTACIGKPDRDWGRGFYWVTLVDGDKEAGVYYYRDIGRYFVTRTTQSDFPYRLRITVDGRPNRGLLKTSTAVKALRQAFADGAILFQDIGIKNLFSNLL